MPAKTLEAGENSIELWFVSDIAPSGASIIRTHDQTDGSDYLYTLLVPADADQLFPCFDQPDLKARVTFTLTTPPAWTALANGSVARSDSGAGRITRHFTETRPLSTYLIAFAAGPWQRTTSVVKGRVDQRLHPEVARRRKPTPIRSSRSRIAPSAGWNSTSAGRIRSRSST